jgi:hypothetical protein
VLVLKQSYNCDFRDALLSYAKHIGHFVLNPIKVSRCARSPAIMQLRDALLSYVPNTLATAKSIVGLVLGLKQSCIARCNSVIRQTQWSSFSQAKCNKLRKLGMNQSCSAIRSHPIPYETQYTITILLKAKVNHYSLDIFLFNNSILRNTRPARVEH